MKEYITGSNSEYKLCLGTKGIRGDRFTDSALLSAFCVEFYIVGFHLKVQIQNIGKYIFLYGHIWTNDPKCCINILILFVIRKKCTGTYIGTLLFYAKQITLMVSRVFMQHFKSLRSLVVILQPLIHENLFIITLWFNIRF